MSRTYTPSRTQLKPTTADEGVVCTGHKRKAAFFTAGPSSKNPGRSFYTCPLGRDDEKRCKFFKWADEINQPHTPQTPQTPSRSAAVRVGEIDWDKVDTDSLEREAIASTPGSSQSTPAQSRLLAAVEDGLKRKRQDDEETPKRAAPNPFLSSPGLASPHHYLTNTLDSLSDLSEHIHRQDRLLAAADKAKEGFRKTIKRQEDRIKELEARVKELEQRL